MELELNQKQIHEAHSVHDKQRVQIETLRSSLGSESANIQNERNTIVQLRADLKLSQASIAEAKSLQAQHIAEIEKLKLALAGATGNVKAEANLKLKLSTERLAK